MRKVISIAVVMMVVMSSCSFEKRCMKWTKRCLPDSTQVYVEKVVHDTDIVVEIFNDTVTLRDTLHIPHYIKGKAPYISIDTLYKKDGIIGLKMWVRRNVLGSEAFLTDSTVLAKAKVEKVMVYKKDVRTVKENTSFAIFTEYFFWLVLLFLLLVCFALLCV